MSTQNYRVEGMTCAHCAASVSREVGAVEGVEGVRVNVADGTVAVDTAAAVPESLIASAVVEAGYAFAGRA